MTRAKNTLWWQEADDYSFTTYSLPTAKRTTLTVTGSYGFRLRFAIILFMIILALVLMPLTKVLKITFEKKYD